MIEITSPNGVAFLCSKPAQDYLKHGGDVANYCNENVAPNQAIPVTISWHSDKKAKSFAVKYSDNPYFFNCEKKNIDGCLNEIQVYNLLKATEYFIEISALYQDGTTEKIIRSFTTSDNGPRPIQIEGVYNTRDLGGYLLSNGKRTKQNMIFRGGALPPCKYYETVGITKNGKAYMSDTLGKKTEIDFRSPQEAENGKDSTIPRAKLVYAYINGYDEIINCTEGYRKLFSLLADKKNYPIYLHCTGGADRTGTVCFLINALLNVDNQSLIEDYEFSSFSYYNIRSINGGWTMPFWENFTNLINSFDGKNINERVEKLMLSIGVTQEEIGSLRKIMIN